MNIESWKQAWEVNNIGFHKSKPHQQLVKYFETLKLKQGGRIFLPLCGKTLDIGWLLAHGVKVCGAEVSELAIEQLFQELGVVPEIIEHEKVLCYSAENIDIYQGDIFDLSQDVLGKVDAIYDRAALVALPEDVRIRYTEHLMQITDAAQQLVITFEYDQSLKSGPPFSVDADELDRLFLNTYTLALLESYVLPGGMKGTHTATENIWQLVNRT